MFDSGYKYIIFDLGDTLIRQKHLLRHIMTKIQMPLIIKVGHKKMSLKEIRETSSKTEKIIKSEYSHLDHLQRKGLWPRIFFKQLGMKISDNLAKEWDEKFDEYYLQNAELMPGAIQILKYLKNKKKKLIIVTNGKISNTNFKMKRFDLEKFFDLLVISERAGERKKNLTPFQIALRKMGGHPYEYLIVGDDMEEDMAAKKMGMGTVLLTDKGKSHFDDLPYIERPDFVINKLEELRKIV